MPSRTRTVARRPTLADVAKIARLVLNHTEAGHGLDNRKLVIDLTTLRRNVDQVLDAINPPPTTDERVSFLVREVIRISARQEIVMARLDPIADAQANQLAALEELARQQAQLATQIGALSANSVTDAEIQSVAATAQGIADAITAAAQAADASLEVEGEDAPAPTPDE